MDVLANRGHTLGWKIMWVRWVVLPVVINSRSSGDILSWISPVSISVSASLVEVLEVAGGGTALAVSLSASGKKWLLPFSRVHAATKRAWTISMAERAGVVLSEWYARPLPRSLAVMVSGALMLKRMLRHVLVTLSMGMVVLAWKAKMVVALRLEGCVEGVTTVRVHTERPAGGGHQFVGQTPLV